MFISCKEEPKSDDNKLLIMLIILWPVVYYIHTKFKFTKSLMFK